MIKLLFCLGEQSFVYWSSDGVWSCESCCGPLLFVRATICRRHATFLTGEQRLQVIETVSEESPGIIFTGSELCWFLKCSLSRVVLCKSSNILISLDLKVSQLFHVQSPPPRVQCGRTNHPTWTLYTHYSTDYSTHVGPAIFTLWQPGGSRLWQWRMCVWNVCVCAHFLPPLFFYVLVSQKPKWRRRRSQSGPRGIPEQTFYAAEAEMVCDSSTGSSLIVLCSPKTGLRSPNVWADRIMFVVPVEKWQERPKQTSSCFTFHKSLVWLSASAQSLDLQSHGFKVVRVGSRATPQPHNAPIVPEALETPHSVICVWKVCVVVWSAPRMSHTERLVVSLEQEELLLAT